MHTHTHVHTYTYTENCCNALARRRVPRQTDRETNETYRLRKGGSQQQNRIRIRSRAHFVFFLLLLLLLSSLLCRLCRLSSVRAAVNRFSAQVTRRITVTRRRRATRLGSRAGELSLNLLTNQYHCQYTRTLAHTRTHTHTHVSLACRRLRLCGNGTQIMAIKIN